MKAHIGICMPYYGIVHPATMRALEQLTDTSEHEYAIHWWKGDPNIDHARAIPFAMWMQDPRHTHLLTLDADVWWEPGAIDRLVARELPVVAGAYPYKAPKGSGLHNRVVGVGWPGEDAVRALRRMRYIGAGFVLCKASVMRRLCKLHPELRFHLPASEVNPEFEGRVGHALWLPQIVEHALEGGGVWREYQTDDWAFCHRVREAGYDIWLDTTVRLRHCAPGQVYHELTPEGGEG